MRSLIIVAALLALSVSAFAQAELIPTFTVTCPSGYIRFRLVSQESRARPLERMLLQNYDRQLSLLKFMRFLSQSPARFIRVFQSLSLSNKENQVLHQTLVRYCCHDKRKRRNYSDAWHALA